MSVNRQPEQKLMKKRKYQAYLLIVQLSLFIINHTSLVIAGSYKYVIIDNNTIYNSEDFIMNNLGEIIWCQLNNDGLLDLCLYKGGNINKLTTINTAGNVAKFNINNIGQVVWAEYDEQNFQYQIYLYTNNSIRMISDPNYFSTYPSGSPLYTTWINNLGQVVWVEKVNDNYRLCLYENETITRIVAGNAPIYQPQINDNGWIIWKTHIISGGQVIYKICLYNKVDVIEVITTLSNYLYYIQINNKNQIVFTEDYHQIKLYEEGTTKTIWESTAQIGFLHLNNSGAMVWCSAGQNIYYYHNGNITQLPTIGDNWGCRINNKDQIVWKKRITINIGNIYYYANGFISKISNSDNSNDFAKINDFGQVVWLSGGNICLATPITNMSPINYLLLGD